MAVATVTNSSGLVLNALQSGGYGISPDAVGGNVERPVPFPFGSNGSYAVGASKTLAVRERDLSVRPQAQQPMLPADELNNYVQRGWLTISFAAETASVIDVEDNLISSI